MTKDSIFSTPREQIGDFKFNQEVADVFSDMIQRSVPGYHMMLEMIAVISGEFVAADSHCYDLGCSLGASTLAIRQGITQPGCRIFAIDNSEAMIERCKVNIERDNAGDTPATPVEVRCQDISESPIENASLVVMNLTLQFIAPEKRLPLLQKIYQGLRPGGALVLSEKFAAEDARDNDLLIKLYHDFKKARGYSELEIAQKRSALEKVLIPDTPTAHRARLRQAGFNTITTWFQGFNFCSLLAVKST